MPNPKREQVIALASKIAETRAEIESANQDLRRFEAQLDVLLNETVPIAAPAANSLAAGQFAEREAERGLVNYILDRLLLAESDMDTDELMEQLPPGTNIASVRSALARLASEERILRTARGRYAIGEHPKTAPRQVAS